MADTLDRLSQALGDRYAVERELARGGMGVVYLARDLRHGRRVAIKVLPPELSAALGTERFLSEIRITASLEHPHALTLIDSGEADGLLYYVMPFVDGESLRDRLDRVGRLPLAEAVQTARDVAGALDHAHAAGIVHRDVKPANILLSAGAAVVTDFGIALAVSQAGGERLTGTGAVLGTPSYMSPEQAAGEECGPASDVFALAAVVYEMLTGRPPFEGNTFQSTLARVLTEEPPSVTSLVPSLPRSVDEALSRGLAKDPARRFPSAGELAAALAPEPARRLSPLGRTALASATLTVVAFLGLGGAHLYRQVADERWVRNVAIPELGRLLDEGRLVEAHDLAVSARERSPDDAVLEELLHTSSGELRITSRPSGANASYQAFDHPEGPWQALGTTPVEGALVPKAHIRVRLERDGYRTLELGFMALWAELHSVLVPEGPEPGDMVWIPSGVVSLSGVPVAVDSFLIDRTEVTNADFRAFVDGGGYASPDSWPVDVLREAESLSWEQARELFEDATGRPGPSTWRLSRPPEGQEALPVGGVSWYEAVAYCRSAGKELPTYHHWQRAAALEMGVTDDVLDLSNFDGQGPAPVASGGAVGLYGTHDLAGNVKEWVWN
ncbi:MAG TPA: bifunctional serine/threonine-protein kinase/formylglycine-generating enzyme family protein, partial [Longimicrobiales bacterium]|nr:bifunctional serine/threonine-protein kinase/formylglycine-generating enzyme family protein [Longimicrobiales bacterium]